MINRFYDFLGPARSRLLIVLLGSTGLVSLMLNAVIEGNDWVPGVQSLLVLTFVIGAAIIIGGRLPRQARLRWLAILAPAFGVILLGILFFPDALPLIFGAAVGWIIAGIFIFRNRVPQEYQRAIKALRNNDYPEAVKIMDGLIKVEPDTLHHYEFRARLLRLWDKLGRARRDYEKMLTLQPASAVAYSGLAELALQEGDYPAARDAGLRAYELSPDDWVAAYNLGMIEDRMGRSEDVISHLTDALKHKVKDTRHRLLIHLYLARAYMRLGQQAAAVEQLELMKKTQGGIEEWEFILKDNQAKVLRAVLADDVALAAKLVDGEVDVTVLNAEAV